MFLNRKTSIYTVPALFAALLLLATELYAEGGSKAGSVIAEASWTP